MGDRRRSGTGRTARTPQPRRGQRSRAKLVAAVGLPLLVAVGLIGLIPSSDSGGDDPVVSTTTTLPPASPEAKAFETRVNDALRVLAGERLRPVIQAASQWMEQKATAETLSGELSLFIPEAVKTRQALAAIPPLKEAPAARDLYRDSIGLYADFGRIYLVAVDPAAEALRPQLDLAARRLRSLADKIYDQAHALVDPASAQSLEGDDVIVRRAPEVPDWEAEGLAAGPPLAEAPPPPPPVPPEREAQRDEEPEKEWEARVRKAGFPSGADLAAALGSGDPARLGALAETYLASVAALRVAPDPEGGRVRAAVVALSFLVEAESARLAQAAALLPAGPARDRLTRVAERLALTGENLLEPDLRGRPSGLDPALLDDPAP